MSLLLLWVTQNILVMYEASHPKKDGKKDLEWCGKECRGNTIATRKICLIILMRRLRKKSKM